MIKYYTSEVPADRSIQKIEAMLVKNGAKNIMKEYDESGQLAAITFIITHNGKFFPYKLPAKIANIERIFQKRHPQTAKRKIREQAERTAWKIQHDWVEIQMSFVAMGQAELMEIFLPYLYFSHEKMTFYEQIKANDYKLLTE